MSKTIRTSLMGLIFWAVFAPFAILTIALQPLLILIYAFSPSDKIRDWVYRTGKAIDQLDNAALFAGNPKETISSHTGRWYASGREVPLKFKVVHWITNLFEKDHVIKAIEEPFRDAPL